MVAVAVISQNQHSVGATASVTILRTNCSPHHIGPHSSHAVRTSTGKKCMNPSMKQTNVCTHCARCMLWCSKMVVVAVSSQSQHSVGATASVTILRTICSPHHIGALSSHGVGTSTGKKCMNRSVKQTSVCTHCSRCMLWCSKMVVVAVSSQSQHPAGATASAMTLRTNYSQHQICPLSSHAVRTSACKKIHESLFGGIILLTSPSAAQHVSAPFRSV